MARPDLATPFIQGLQTGATLVQNMQRLRQEQQAAESQKELDRMKQETERIKVQMDQQRQISDQAMKFVSDDKIQAPRAKMDTFNKAVLPYLNALLPQDQQIGALTEWSDRESQLAKAVEAVNKLPEDVGSRERQMAIAEQLSAYGFGAEALKTQQELAKPKTLEEQALESLPAGDRAGALQEKVFPGKSPERPEIRTDVLIDDKGTKATIERDPGTGVWTVVTIGGKPVQGRTPDAPGGGKVSADERNAAGFYGRMTASTDILEAKFKDFVPSQFQYTAGTSVLTGSGYVPTSVTTRVLGDDGQQYFQAVSDWVRAKLRKESGAAIGKEEAIQEISTYFPLPGEGPDVIKQKNDARKQANEQMKLAAGNALRPALESFERP